MKSIFQFKFSWILAILFIAFSFILILGYYQSKENPQHELSSAQPRREKRPDPKSAQVQTSKTAPRAIKSHLQVNKAVVCLDVSNDGRPLVAKQKFHHGIDFLVCYAELSGIDEPQVLTHRWVHENDIVAEKQVWLKAGTDAVWTKCNMPRDQRGNWRVDLVSAAGKVLDFAVFQID